MNRLTKPEFNEKYWKALEVILNSEQLKKSKLDYVIKDYPNAIVVKPNLNNIWILKCSKCGSSYGLHSSASQEEILLIRNDECFSDRRSRHLVSGLVKNYRACGRTTDFILTR